MLFRPVFNIADAAISIGVGMIILFQRKYFGKVAVADENNDNLEVSSTEDKEQVAENTTATTPEKAADSASESANSTTHNS